MIALQQYGSSDDENEAGESSIQSTSIAGPSEFSIKNQLQICAAPIVLPTVFSSFCENAIHFINFIFL